MNHRLIFALGVLATVMASAFGLVVMPNWQFRGLSPVEDDRGVKHPTAPFGQAFLGRQVYADLGCIYCHSEQVEPRISEPTSSEAGGRAEVLRAITSSITRPLWAQSYRPGPGKYWSPPAEPRLARTAPLQPADHVARFPSCLRIRSCSDGREQTDRFPRGRYGSRKNGLQRPPILFPRIERRISSNISKALIIHMTFRRPSERQ